MIMYSIYELLKCIILKPILSLNKESSMVGMKMSYTTKYSIFVRPKVGPENSCTLFELEKTCL
ncbi:hypothetical protein HanIR_Chr15g0781541 [Helianthus annuus]|nr:hypothetical protein HanIR_Chr15g0781541 [Helianthus annuus]